MQTDEQKVADLVMYIGEMIDDVEEVENIYTLLFTPKLQELCKNYEDVTDIPNYEALESVVGVLHKKLNNLLHNGKKEV